MNRYTRDQWHSLLWPQHPEPWQPWQAPQGLQITVPALTAWQQQGSPGAAIPWPRLTAGEVLVMSGWQGSPWRWHQGRLWILDPAWAAWVRLQQP